MDRVAKRLVEAVRMHSQLPAPGTAVEFGRSRVPFLVTNGYVRSPNLGSPNVYQTLRSKLFAFHFFC